MAKACGKTPHRSRAAAAAAARATYMLPQGSQFRMRAYRCTACRFDAGQRAWHWTRDGRKPRHR